jgi:flagellar biogenesis protein FliO
MRCVVKEGDGEQTMLMPGGFAGWLLARLRRTAQRPQPRLALLERIALGPRQSLALVEAEGRRLLVATSPEGAPTFYALDATDSRRPKTRRAMSEIPFQGYVC